MDHVALLNDSTATVGQHSAGPSVTRYTTHLAPALQPEVTVSGIKDGYVRIFLTGHVDATVGSPLEASSINDKRMLGALVMARAADELIDEMYASLVDKVLWHYELGSCRAAVQEAGKLVGRKFRMKDRAQIEFDE